MNTTTQTAATYSVTIKATGERREMTLAEIADLHDRARPTLRLVRGGGGGDVAPAKGTIVIRDIPQKSYKQFGKVHERPAMVGHHAEIVPGVSIRLHGVETNRVNGPVAYDTTWKVGDTCIVGGYNMTYFGEITAIGKSTVSVTSVTGGRQRFDVADFSHKNAAEDYAVHSKRNSEWMD